MVFGLCNTPAMVQHSVNNIFRDTLDHFVVIYLDDILVISENWTQHACHILERLYQNLYAKLEKCEFDWNTVCGLHSLPKETNHGPA